MTVGSGVKTGWKQSLSSHCPVSKSSIAKTLFFWYVGIGCFQIQTYLIIELYSRWGKLYIVFLQPFSSNLKQQCLFVGYWSLQSHVKDPPVSAALWTWFCAWVF